jgi:hypothetical protein
LRQGIACGGKRLSKSLNDHCDQGLVKNFFRVKAEDFQSIPGFPIAYWASTALINSFKSKVRLGERLDTAQGMKTLDNERFIREWSEVSFFTITNSENFQKKWVPINHGGGYRKWYGLNSSVLNWTNDGSAIKALAKEKYNSITRTVTGMGHYFENGITWSAISTDFISVRKFPDGFIFTNAGMCAFGPLKNQLAVAALLNSKVGVEVLKILAPSVNFGPNQISEIPVAELDNIGSKLIGPVNTLIEIARFDWDLYESSSNFTNFPLLNTGSYHVLLADSYKAIRAQWCDLCKEDAAS